MSAVHKPDGEVAGVKDVCLGVKCHNIRSERDRDTIAKEHTETDDSKTDREHKTDKIEGGKFAAAGAVGEIPDTERAQHCRHCREKSEHRENERAEYAFFLQIAVAADITLTADKIAVVGDVYKRPAYNEQFRQQNSKEQYQPDRQQDKGRAVGEERAESKRAFRVNKCEDIFQKQFKRYEYSDKRKAKEHKRNAVAPFSAHTAQRLGFYFLICHGLQITPFRCKK